MTAQTKFNPYYSPEEVGLTVVGEVDDAGSYEFNTIVVWTDGEKLYWAHDSGCSCPTPFEEYEVTKEDKSGLDELKESNLQSFIDGVMEMELPLAERREFIDRVKRLLRGK